MSGAPSQPAGIRAPLAIRTSRWHTMIALPVKTIHANATLIAWRVKAGRRVPTAVGASLILLLVFSTVTAFVQDAWSIQSFQIGIYALVAVYLLVNFRSENERIAS